mgnify:CR=1 FL=1
MTICRERGNIFKQSASRSFTSEISGLRKQYGMRGWRNWQTRTFEVRVVYPWGFESPSLAPKTSTHRVLVFLFVRGRGSRTRRRHLCRKQSHSAALLSLRVPTRRNVYQGCTHFCTGFFFVRGSRPRTTLFIYIKESAMNSENSSRFSLYAGSGGRTTKND